ncbi:MAG TPA: hypothetical protein VLW55_01820 [Burkholderiaceae bacterium]|nr:hypothetical protein [Burkholderiaceae bacterium]
MLDYIGLQWPNAGAVDNAIALAKCAGFQGASPDTRKELLSALWKHPTDATFCSGLQNLARDCRKLTPTQQANAIRSFSAVAESEAYADIRALYRSDKKFAEVVDGMYATLNGSTDPDTGIATPPARVDAEEARQRLLDVGLSSDYLKKPGNVDNH